jgi:hypothetical protein
MVYLQCKLISEPMYISNIPFCTFHTSTLKIEEGSEEAGWVSDPNLRGTSEAGGMM